jgi:integrase
MATLYLSLSTKLDITQKQEILVRFSHGHINQRAKTGIFIPSEYWDVKARQIIIPNFRLMNDERRQTLSSLSSQKEKLGGIIKAIHDAFNESDKKNIADGWLKGVVSKFNSPEPKQDEIQRQTFFETFDEFMEKRKLSKAREAGFMVLKRALQRFELFVSIKEKLDFRLEIDNITDSMITDFENFFRTEHELYYRQRELYDRLQAITGVKYKKKIPHPRGTNTINALFTELRTFFNWCYNTDKTSNRPFRNYEKTPDLYGTPVYITIEERNRIYNTDLSSRPGLAVQRDIFVFQCLTGCRISDLYKLTKQSIINDAIEYIPRKTKDGHPVTVRVPLNSIAKEILSGYYGFEGDTLFPYISKQSYNYAIKEIFVLSGITRIVTVLNPTTREEEKRPVNEIASSHLARRCFVGNLYKQVKDPNLVGALSGHRDGSQAFARYRDIDEDMKRELVKMLE